MFTGFGPETMDFLWGIRMNNNKAWFEAHKQDYVNYLYGPMKALGQSVFEGFRQRPDLELKVSRIYRDARLHPPVPYKESLWLCIRRPVAEWSRHPALYFEIRPEGGSCGFLLWQPGASVMEAFRQDLLARPDFFPTLVRTAQEESGLTLKAEGYKRPKPCDNPALAPHFAWKGCLEASRGLEPGPELFSPDLPRYLTEALRPWLPVCDYFSGFTGSFV